MSYLSGNQEMSFWRSDISASNISDSLSEGHEKMFRPKTRCLEIHTFFGQSLITLRFSCKYARYIKLYLVLGVHIKFRRSDLTYVFNGLLKTVVIYNKLKPNLAGFLTNSYRTQDDECIK
jgi:hypothetical protein